MKIMNFRLFYRGPPPFDTPLPRWTALSLQAAVKVLPRPAADTPTEYVTYKLDRIFVVVANSIAFQRVKLWKL